MIPKEGILLKTKASSGIQARLIRGCKATSSPRVQLDAGYSWSKYIPLRVSIDVVELIQELKRRKLLPWNSLPSTSTTSSKAVSTDIAAPLRFTREEILAATTRST